jgi:Skp family chaperone for outer membrane proteins
MRYFFILISFIAVSTVPLSAKNYFSYNQKTSGGKVIAYYNSDSILHILPEYKKAMDSIAFVKHLLDYQDSMLNIRYFTKINEIQENCLRWTPAVLSMNKKLADGLYETIQDYRVEVKLDLDNMYQKLIPPIIEKITAAAKKVGEKNNYLALLDSNSLVMFSPKVKVVNISKDVCKQLGIEETKK